jgi:hypothetical protein
MLSPHEIFAQLPLETAARIFADLHEVQKPLYKAAVDSLAKAHNLRPVFVERKSRAEQHLWLADKARRRQHDSIAAHLLQAWLVGSHKGLLCDFLDGFGIAHDENGTVEVLPQAPPKEDLLRVITGLRSRYDSHLLAIYLNTFQSLDSEGWDTLAALIEEDPTLQLDPAKHSTAVH